MINRDRALAIVIVWVIGFALLGVYAAIGQTTGVDLDLNQIRERVSGERFLEAEISVTDEQIGQTCDANLDRRNNESTHAVDGHPDHGTNIIIESGVNGTVFTNVESEAFEEATRSFVIGGPIRVYTQIGHDEVSSMGYGLEFECNPLTTTTSTTSPPPTVDSTTTTSTTGPPPVTTTTEPPPINGIDTGGGGCADGACDVSMAATTLSADGNWSLSPLTTWVLIGVVWSLLAGLAWAFIHGATRRSDG